MNEENLNEFNVRFETIGRVVSLFRSEFEIIEDDKKMSSMSILLTIHNMFRCC